MSDKDYGMMHYGYFWVSLYACSSQLYGDEKDEKNNQVVWNATLIDYDLEMSDENPTQ
jgi:hypothetical protein